VWSGAAKLSEVSTPGFEPEVVRAAYTSIADSYDATYGKDLDDLVLDRRVLDTIVSHLEAGGTVLDVGCGPAHVCRYLISRGTDAVGVDFTRAMLAAARTEDASVPLIAADLLALPVRSSTAQAIVVFYVLQHMPRSTIGRALRELHRVLKAQGLIAVAVHEGDAELRVGQVTATLYRADELADRLTAANFVIESIDRRDPLPHEHQGPRAYLLARAM
jgi:ubiquinone/menaquinone biosynthesis C-methylase UbiE